MQTTSPRTRPQRSPRWPIYGAAAFGLATALSAIGVFAGQREQDQVDAFPALVVFFAILTGLVFALAVRPTAGRGASSRRVLALAALAFLGIAVFWAGLPAIFGLAALAVRPDAPPSRTTSVGMVLAVVALAANVVLAFVG